MRLRTIAALIGAASGGCGKESCLRGECVSACDSLAFGCEPGALVLGRLGDHPELRLIHGEGADDDLVLSNGVVTAVLDALDAPHDLAPTGGNLIDLGVAGGVDDLNIVYQIAGVLPDDAFAYDRIETIETAELIAVIAHGRLDGRDDVAVVTRYELRPCDPGLRVRSELFNGSPDVHAWVVADVPHWGKRRAIPFAPRPDQGYLQPELDLLELDALYDRYDYGAAASYATDSPGYAFAACNQSGLEGINDLEISALGTPRGLVRPGETVVLERFWAAAGAGIGPAAAIEAALAVRGQLLGDAAPLVVTGRIVADGLGFGGAVRRASVILTAGDTPRTAVVPADDGTFRAAVPPGAELGYQVSSFGRVVASGAVPADGAIGDIAIDLPATLQVTVTAAAAPIHAQVVLTPSRAEDVEGLTGTFHGRFDPCAPWLGPPHGGSPACNRFLVDPTGGEAEVPAGRYDVYAVAGPDHTLGLAEDVALTAGEITTLGFDLTPLDVVPAGWLRADLHVHGRASFDSAIPDADRVRSFVAAGIDVIAATDHDAVTDYADAIAGLGVGDQVAVMGGAETTQLIPWLAVPGDDFPRVIGHFNFWPIEPVPGAARGGLPWDELVEPGALFDRMAPLIGDGGVMMMNHPWDDSSSGRDLGYLRAIKFDPRVPIPAADDGSRNGMLLRAPGGGHRNVDWDVVEVQNGGGVVQAVRARPLWAALISQGFVAAGASNSDSHGLSDAQLGWGRTLVETGGDLAGFDPDDFDAALRDGRAAGGSGIAILVTIVDDAGAAKRGLGFEPYRPAPGDRVRIEVRAAPWIPIDEVRVMNRGGVRRLAPVPAPASETDPLRFAGELAIDELVGAGDDWFVIEAGLELPEYADLDDDGVADTGDNDGDGDVDEEDVEEGEETGPMREPELGGGFGVVLPRVFPYAFTSPILVDGDGGGWDPPGLAP